MVRTLLGGVFIVGGLFFFMVGTLGILRFPDVFTRVHSAAKCDTLGALLSLTGLIVFNGFNTLSFKLILILLFIWVTNPTATHLIGKSEYLKRNTKKEGRVEENETI
ncbi:multicomponent Na+:H+ antiporter subunit G [Clostridium tetanomorphum]|uniref:Monovalent cation/H(+) antiporter subunit G n=1 Tax=Clostridium tetanomorphum TaxID=1553 RepID=A0A923EDK2_CLOTT|nr:monovalent cation/H(+) antiporter subunit G [Clostridium tetanomorphum]KAJ52472.1 monovalent cation/proton antiporter subunit MnhG/PhaG [Clostridium tetanomorphum DSM 665]MBC2399496.1 monovalent cation/H(+) antiporter subunit G [Clostridium tetanomorphum]MBP1864151.1 multicomponent Na+:H+ antiporter subunit G [Clostridium tetanomorphum]NRS84564.1 multicomponent Na+:H+ antiporter subunit G [Clostridium tetanomorphum]NRZ97778.1 multicomponent Na+:H+ antiporter subunit G [Clostridium tetanomor